MKETIYHIRWNDHEALIRAKSNTNAREQAQMLYGRDALSWRMCPCKVATDEVIARLVREGRPVFRYDLPLKREAVVDAERHAYQTLTKQKP